ncbi:MAG: cytochrome c maturation protein CcmE [Fimbriimonadaceae bacterium]
MKPSALIAIIAGALGLTAMMYAFLTQASPYVTVAQAKEMNGDNLHLAGDLDRASLDVDTRQGHIEFFLTDEEGKRQHVMYDGPPPSNMGSATQVVAVGGMGENGTFVARRLILKCPSKYEEGTNVATR